MYVIDMAGRQWVCGWSPTGRFGDDVHIEIEIETNIEIEMDTSVGRADDVFTVSICAGWTPHCIVFRGGLLMVYALVCCV